MIVVSLVPVGCKRDASEAQMSASKPPDWFEKRETAAPRPGMAWIEKGVLIAGTPPDRIPRVPDAEMAGEQIIMGGFYVDLYPYPNEVGAIPTTNVTREEAAHLCEKGGKRLCTELELERACKGAANQMYPGSDEYRPGACGTGERRQLVPNGFHAQCRSAFGVHDLVGSVWVWTASDWGRGTEGLAALRGGNGEHGELVGRCAHGRGEAPEKKSADIGFRCCAGEVNTFEVVLAVERGDALRYRINDREMNARFESTIRASRALREGDLSADKAEGSLRDQETFVAERSWTWKPLGNEELLLGGGCTRAGPGRACGVLVARMLADGLKPLAWIATGRWQPTVSEGTKERDLYVLGGDDGGAFRKRVVYEWGKMRVGEPQRKKKRGRKYVYED